MFPQFFSNLLVRRIICNNQSKSVIKISNYRLAHQLTEVKESCEYPAIFDASEEARPRYERQLWYNSIKSMPTVEEKLHELAVHQKKELKKYLLSVVPPSFNGTLFQRYITRTHLIHGLPNKLARLQVDLELAEISEVFEEVLTNHYCNPWSNNPSKLLDDHLNEEHAGADLVNKLISKCYKKLAPKNEYILDSTTHLRPRQNSFWWHGGFKTEDEKESDENLCFHFEDRPAFIIRMKKPLSPILSLDDSLCATAEVPNYNYHPNAFAITSETARHLTSIPGFWPGDPHEFPLLIVNTSDKMQPLLNKIEKYDISKIEDSVGIMTSFGGLNAVATYQGFTPFHDVTYPFVTQTILTNGQDWNFFVYQLNTIALHSDVDNKDRRNICWSSGKLRLFESIEDGHVKGINDEVFKILLKFLLNAPIHPEDLVLKPYLEPDTRSEDDILNLRYFTRRMNSQAPDPCAHKDEIPAWQKIYKFHPDAPPCPYVKME